MATEGNLHYDCVIVTLKDLASVAEGFLHAASHVY